MTTLAIGTRVPHAAYGHLAWNRTHRHATLWKVVRKDGVVLAFTDHSRALRDFAGQVYTPMGIAQVSARRRESGLKQQNLEMLGMLDHDSITDFDLMTGKYRDAAVSEMLVDWEFPFLTPMIDNRYWVDGVSFTGEVWTAQVSGVARWLASQTGEIYSKTCRYSLGDGRCGYDLESDPFVVSGTVTKILRGRIEIQTTLTSAPLGKYDWGFLRWTSGFNSGAAIDVKTYDPTGGRFVFQLPVSAPIGLGDGFTAYPGCDKLWTTCRDVFANLANFGGFQYIPSTDAVMQEEHLA